MWVEVSRANLGLELGFFAFIKDRKEGGRGSNMCPFALLGGLTMFCELLGLSQFVMCDDAQKK